MHTNETEWVQNVDLYIGNNATYNESGNRRCANGPFMRTDDPDSFTTFESGEQLWKYGFEAWCNLEGQFLHIVSNLTNLAGQGYAMSICSIGIMGTEYARPVNSSLPELV